MATSLANVTLKKVIIEKQQSNRIQGPNFDSISYSTTRLEQLKFWKKKIALQSLALSTFFSYHIRLGNIIKA